MSTLRCSRLLISALVNCLKFFFSDEAATKNLLIQLADRDIISHETLLERFKEIPQVENIRMKRELRKRNSIGPEKAGPFHPPPAPDKKEPTTPQAPNDLNTNIGP